MARKELIKMEPVKLYADVILPLALPELFTYEVPFELHGSIVAGQRVVVQFGKQRVYAALVYRLHNSAPLNYQTKDILEVIDELPVITQKQFDLWQWMADYYLCHLGEIMAAGLPSALRLQSESVVIRNPNFIAEVEKFTDREYLVWEAFEFQPELSIQEISKILSLKYVMPVIKNLIKKGAILVHETIEEKYKAKNVEYVSLHEECPNEEQLGILIQSIEKKAPKQVDLILAYFSITRENEIKEVGKTVLLKRSDVNSTVLNALVKKKIFKVEKKQVDRFPVYKGEIIPSKDLNVFQEHALKEIQYAFTEHKVTLLHGVTSSGKTEVYIHLIQEVLDQGKQVLYMLPEIALTTQVIKRLQKHFGNQLFVYHSRFNENERVEVWNKILDDNLNDSPNRGKIVVGARSSLFLPFSNLGLVIVDEEHDHSYKQVDPAPRYNARDAAIVLANKQDANVLLGTATPSLESYFNALSGKYTLVQLDKRFAGLEMPDVSIIDLKEVMKRKLMNGHFSSKLIDEISNVITNKQQVILFQNRRGFAPFLECGKCSWVPICVNCDVALTYHKSKHELRCHYCGYLTNPPYKCGACGDHDLKMRGFGTERIAEDLQLILPEAVIARLDHDTTKSKYGFHQILSDFEEGNIDVLVGTQMVTKGLDFDNVKLVGILSADAMLHFPDFRSYERGFQLLSQVSGRAGRKNSHGKVLIQTYNPSNKVLQHVIRHDYKSFYNEELVERYKFGYPPYTRLIELRLKHKDLKHIEEASEALSKALKAGFGKRVLGPTTPTVMRIRNFYLRTILLKIEKTLSVADVKKKLINAIDKFKKEPNNRQLIIHIDVDPI